MEPYTTTDLIQNLNNILSDQEWVYTYERCGRGCCGDWKYKCNECGAVDYKHAPDCRLRATLDQAEAYLRVEAELDRETVSDNPK
jgi:hypothetical protein